MALNDIFYNLASLIPWGANQPQSVAQARITHTPIAYESQVNPNIWGGTTPNMTWGEYAAQHASRLQDIDPATQGVIQIFNRGGVNDPTALHHEIIHAATIPDLQPGSDLYRKVQKLIPDDVANLIKTNYRNQDGSLIPHDPVHEGVSWLLGEPNFQDKKYNAAKLKVVNAFPAATKAKLIRILGQ